MAETYQDKIHIVQGAEEMVIPSGCKITVQSGGEIDLDTGATISLPDKVLQAADIPLADGKVLIGDATGKAVAQTPSGDVTVTNAGAMAIGAHKVTSGMLGTSCGLVVACSGGATMSREQNLAGLSSALTLVNEARGDIINHFGNATRHITALQNLTGIPDAATNLSTLLALAGFLLTAYAAHNADVIKASAWEYHDAQDTTHALVSAVTPTTLEQAVTRLNDLKAKYNAHELESTGHHSQGTVAANQVAASDAAYGAVNRVPATGALSGDIPFWSILNDGTGNVTGVSAAVNVADFIDFTFSADPQNDSVISYILVRAAA